MWQGTPKEIVLTYVAKIHPLPMRVLPWGETKRAVLAILCRLSALRVILQNCRVRCGPLACPSQELQTILAVDQKAAMQVLLFECPALAELPPSRLMLRLTELKVYSLLPMTLNMLLYIG